MQLFDALPEEKRLTILNAAFTCFGKNGYKKTSVADIAAAAGISKASVFQYFNSKAGLYVYLFEYACDEIMNDVPEGTDDFFECIALATEVKMSVMQEYPGMFDFLSSNAIETDESILALLKPITENRISATSSNLFNNVNWGKLKEGLNSEKIFNMVRWVNEGYLQTAIGNKDAQTMRRELFEYLELIKKAYYKEEFL
jgi:Transcriptional regulator